MSEEKNNETRLEDEEVVDHPPENQKELRRIGKLINESLIIFHKKLKFYLLIVLIPLAVFSLTALSFYYFFITYLHKGSFGFTPLLLLLFFLAIIISIVISIFWKVSLITAIHNRDHDFSIKEVYGKVWKNFPFFIWVYVLLIFFIGGGYFLFLIPGWIFSVWFVLAIYIAVCEDERGVKALLKSKEYIKGYWWSVWWKIYVAGFFISIFRWGLERITSDLYFFQSIILLLFYAYTQILLTIYVYLIYQNLKEIKKEEVLNTETKNIRPLVIVSILGYVVLAGLLILAFHFFNIYSDQILELIKEEDITSPSIKLN